MKNSFGNLFVDSFNEVALTQEDLDQFEKYHKQYANMPENYLLREIMEVKNTLSEEVLQQHKNNLALFAQMQGFVSEGEKNKIEYLKKILESDTTPYRRRYAQTPAEKEQFFGGGSSLLLWFLLLNVIWRRPFVYRSPY